MLRFKPSNVTCSDVVVYIPEQKPRRGGQLPEVPLSCLPSTWMDEVYHLRQKHNIRAEGEACQWPILEKIAISTTHTPTNKLLRKHINWPHATIYKVRVWSASEDCFHVISTGVEILNSHIFIYFFILTAPLLCGWLVSFLSLKHS